MQISVKTMPKTRFPTDARRFGFIEVREIFALC